MSLVDMSWVGCVMCESTLNYGSQVSQLTFYILSRACSSRSCVCVCLCARALLFRESEIEQNLSFRKNDLNPNGRLMEHGKHGVGCLTATCCLSCTKKKDECALRSPTFHHTLVLSIYLFSLSVASQAVRVSCQRNVIE